MDKKYVTNPIYQDYKELWGEVHDLMQQFNGTQYEPLRDEIEQKLIQIDLFLKTIVESFWLEAPFNEAWVEVSPHKAGKCSGTGSVAT